MRASSFAVVLETAIEKGADLWSMLIPRPQLLILTKARANGQESLRLSSPLIVESSSWGSLSPFSNHLSIFPMASSRIERYPDSFTIGTFGLMRFNSSATSSPSMSAIQ